MQGYPFTRDMITKEAEIDIPPLLRGDIWMALLNIKGDYQNEYLQIDKETPTNTDRQVLHVKRLKKLFNIILSS